MADPTARAAWEDMSAQDRETVTRIYANIGKAIAAYERKLMPGPSRFDAYVQAVLNGDAAAMQATFTPDEAAGLRLFVGKANCINCHSGPLLTNNDFHNTGVPAVAGLPEDTGRALGARQVQADEFNCLSRYSDAQPAQCAELRFLKPEGAELVRAFSHHRCATWQSAGRLCTRASSPPSSRCSTTTTARLAAPAGHSELEPLGLSEQELAQLVAFLKTLSGPLATP